jgi:hypothetical protein
MNVGMEESSTGLFLGKFTFQPFLKRSEKTQNLRAVLRFDVLMAVKMTVFFWFVMGRFIIDLSQVL